MAELRFATQSRLLLSELVYSTPWATASLWRPTGVLLPASEAREIQGTCDKGNSPFEKVCLSEEPEVCTDWQTRWQG